MGDASDIVRLKVTLDDVTPVVMRRIEVPLGIHLDRLHAVLQVAIGWTNSHLWEIRVRDVSWGIPDLDRDEGPRDASKTTLVSVLDDIGGKAKSLAYLYDIGDSWEHTIKVEHIGAAETGVLYPRLIEAAGRCPPEDIGGAPGYAEFLEAIADPDHERHEELTEWYDGDFDPAAVNVLALKRQLANLVKRWRPKSKRSGKAS